MFRMGALVMVALATGCATDPGGSGRNTETAPQAPDAVALFAASATPGSVGNVVVSETGQSVRVRLVRAYAAASGRECREVALSTAAQNRLLCRSDTGWAEAQPLLRGVTPRP